jgi:anti-anti-sigma factor
VPTDLRLNSRRTGAVSILRVAGEIDLSNCARAEAELHAARHGARVLVLDLREVRFIDTSGLRLILEERQRAQSDGYRFLVTSSSSAVQRLFEVAGLSPEDGLFIDSPDDALQDHGR